MRVLLVLLLVSCGAPTVQVLGPLSWEVRYSPEPSGPGPNRFLPDLVWWDEQGLHLAIREVNGVWWSSELYTREPARYGTYRFFVEARLDQLDPQMVVGLFLYAPPNPTPREVDIEFARWGDARNPWGQYVVQPYDAPGHLFRFGGALPDARTTHEFRWTPGRVVFRSWLGHRPAPGSLLAEWTYEGADVPKEAPDLRLHINFWLFRGAPPQNGQGAEILIRQVTFEPY